MWSVGCIFGELMLMKAIFQGKNEKDQLDKIFKVKNLNRLLVFEKFFKIKFCSQDLGTPNEKIWPGYRDMPLVKKLSFPEFPYNTLRSRFGQYLSDLGFDLLIK
jgi:cell division cycle 2-like protein